MIPPGQLTWAWSQGRTRSISVAADGEHADGEARASATIVWRRRNACRRSPPIRPSRNAKISQPTRSLMIAAATITMPTSVRKRLQVHQDLGDHRQRRDRQRGGEEQREDGAARRRAHARASAARPSRSPKPSANGTTMPATATARAVRPCRQTVDRSTSMPATSRNSAMPSVVSAFKDTATSPAAREEARLEPPARAAPSTVGPSRMPARISPRTEGRRSRFDVSPRGAGPPGVPLPTGRGRRPNSANSTGSRARPCSLASNDCTTAADRRGEKLKGTPPGFRVACVFATYPGRRAAGNRENAKRLRGGIRLIRPRHACPTYSRPPGRCSNRAHGRSRSTFSSGWRKNRSQKVRRVAAREER